MLSEVAMAGDAGMFVVPLTVGRVLCCKCGVAIQPNPMNMCLKCLPSEFNITEDLMRRVILRHCPDCDKYLHKQGTWIVARLESRELLALCLGKLKSMARKVRIVDARFLYTEPHSRRIKVELKVQKEVHIGAILEAKHLVEFVQQENMCELCVRVEANPDQWVSVVQLRQRVSHMRTFFYLEQLILAHDAAVRAIRVKQMDHGVDFFFANHSHAARFVEFVGKFAPIRSFSDRQLVSHDTKSNKYNYKYTFSVEILPICREDLICLPLGVYSSLGNLGPLVICTKVTNQISLVDPFSLRFTHVAPGKHWDSSLTSLLSSTRLVKYFVHNLELIPQEISFDGSKYALAHAEVARVSDFGRNDTTFITRTHLGHVLKPGDYALGYDLHGANVNDMELCKYDESLYYDAVLIKKTHGEDQPRRQGKSRTWKLRSLNMEIDGSKGRRSHEKTDAEYEEFLKDLEENPELRFNISLYHNADYQASDAAMAMDGENVSSVPLHELLDDLDLADADDLNDQNQMRD